MKHFYLNSFSLLDFVTYHPLLYHYFVWYITALLSLTKQKKSKLRKNSKYVTSLRQSWRKPFRNKLVAFNYSRPCKIKSIILLCSEVITVYFLSAHEKGTFGFSIKGQRFKNVLIDVLRLFDASPEKTSAVQLMMPIQWLVRQIVLLAKEKFGSRRSTADIFSYDISFPALPAAWQVKFPLCCYKMVSSKWRSRITGKSGQLCKVLKSCSLIACSNILRSNGFHEDKWSSPSHMPCTLAMGRCHNFQL